MDITDYKKVSKAIAGAIAAGVTGVGATVITVPESADMPWWGFVLVGVINAAIGYATVYLAPRNSSI